MPETTVSGHFGTRKVWRQRSLARPEGPIHTYGFGGSRRRANWDGHDRRAVERIFVETMGAHSHWHWFDIHG